MSNSLQAKGLSSRTIVLIQSDLKDALQTSSGTSPKVSDTDVRARLDARLAEEVVSGKISAEDAATVGQTLDEADAAAKGDASATTHAGGGVKSGGGGSESHEDGIIARQHRVGRHQDNRHHLYRQDHLDKDQRRDRQRHQGGRQQRQGRRTDRKGVSGDHRTGVAVRRLCLMADAMAVD
ncbi:hypothetical protein LWE61_03195 [Sphingobium sufflavum]|uniref:hypothetical protein n=1 Tax=Sphingobium sufflavum TaxID=1129547 RepID=UPI001F3EFD1D|nr:hypothetical protein [Sphingobium sufflavum]MCE7795558.1 hypothetical protein [Sphingobium sufflavum]